LLFKGICSKDKNISQRLGEVFAKYIFDERLVSRIQKELYFFGGTSV
jgi:hypothetical protein